MKMIVSIVERGKGAQIQRLYRKWQVILHMQCAGRGTATSEIMDILGLGSSEKDVVLSIATRSSAQSLLGTLNEDLRGSTGTSGIVFDLPLNAISNMAAALVSFRAEEGKTGNGGTAMEQKAEHSLILVSCTRGYVDEVMATAKAQGARGGTMIRGRMSGVEDLEQAYGLELKDEREIIAIVVPREKRDAILNAVNEQHGLRSPAQAVVCSLPIGQLVRL